jgi:hypothetical protein
MRNILKTTILVAALTATSALTVSSAYAEPMNGGVMRLNNGGENGGMRREGGWRQDGGGFGGWGGAVAFLGGLMISHAFIEDSDTHYRKDCIYIGGCKISVTSSPDEPPVVKVEKRKRGPRPIRHVTDKRTGWTYYLAQDRNTGQDFIQIVDANGQDVHINGEIPMPGGGQTYQVR